MYVSFLQWIQFHTPNLNTPEVDSEADIKAALNYTVSSRPLREYPVSQSETSRNIKKHWKIRSSSSLDCNTSATTVPCKTTTQ